MTKKELFVAAHKMAKEIKSEFAEVNYSFQLGLCIAYLAKKGEGEMVVEYKTSKGTVVKVKIEGREIIDLSVNGIELVKNNTNKYDVFLRRGFIGVNNKSLTKKLGLKGTLKLETNDEINNIFDAETEKEIAATNARVESFVNSCTKSYEHYTNSFDNHMTNPNQ